MDIEYVDILTGKNLTSIQVAYLDLIYVYFMLLTDFKTNEIAPINKIGSVITFINSA